MIQTLQTWRPGAASTVAKRRYRPRVFRVSILFAVAALAAVTLTVVTEPAAAQSKTVWDGVYTEQQAARGAVSFASSCARCHEAAANAGEEGKNLAGKAFWESFRESTVDHLLDFVTRNMPNGAGGTLDAKVYADLVAYILSRNELPAGAAELTKDSAVGVKIITKDGPGELPSGTLIRIVGCLARKDGGGWILNSSTVPERPNAAADAGDAARPLGTRSFALMFVLTPLDRFVGHRLRVRGLLMGDGGRDGINVSQTQSVGETCK